MVTMLDELAFFIFLFCFILSIVFMYVSLNKPHSRKGLRHRMLKDWVQKNLLNPSPQAIQALRNQILVNSAFISALLILTGILIGLYPSIFTDSSEFLWGIIPALTIGISQLIVITSITIISLIAFINSNRMAVNLSYLLSSDPANDEINDPNGSILTRDVFRILQRSWMFGIRSIFFIIVTLTWIIHPILFMVATIALAIYLVIAHDFSIFEKKLPKKEKN